MTTAVNAKVEYFQNLKAKMNGRIKIEGVGFIYSLVEDVLGNFEHFKKNELKSENAGYDIIENADGDWMSFLGDRVEINLSSGETFNVWIDAIAYNAETNDIGFLGFMRDSALSAGRQDKVEFWTSVIEYKLKDSKNADTWRKFLGIEINANSEKSNAEIIACIDDYAVDADAAAEVEIENAKNVAEKVKAKVVEIKNRPRKKIIDWSGTFEEVRISEILAMQKEMKKFLRLGQLELAENIFAMLKTLCKNYRGVAA